MRALICIKRYVNEDLNCKNIETLTLYLFSLYISLKSIHVMSLTCVLTTGSQASAKV